MAFALFLIPLFYLFLIILQLALFNLIMFVVMVVWWFKFFRIARAIIKRCIDNSRTKYYRKFIKELKALSCVTENSIEIQEDDEGKWIAVHLPDIAEEDESDEDEDEMGMPEGDGSLIQPENN